MEEILKALDTKEGMKTKEIYGLLKTNSKKINSEISKKIKSFNKIGDFFGHYSSQTHLLELLKIAEFNSTKNYDEIFSSFDSNIEKYISCFTQVILSIKLILKTQEILNKILLSSKHYLLKLKIEKQIENLSQENFFFYVENLLDSSGIKSSRSYSNDSTALSLNSFDPLNYNLLNQKKITDNQNLKSFSSADIAKTLNIYYEEPCTPTFGLQSDNFIENITKENCENIHIRKDPLLTLSGEQIMSLREKMIFFNDKKNSFSEKNFVYNNIPNEKKYENLLEMINSLYKKGMINSEEKVRLKQLVIAKSKKLENLYYNIYKNKIVDQNALRIEITKLMN